MNADERRMALAVRQAALGLGATYPNPSVGAVVFAGDEVVGEGRTAPTGGPHAEIRALQQAGARARGGTLYVTLEPCCHIGRTGPCTAAILTAGVSRVVVGVIDPAEHVNGQGIALLRAAGIEVVVGVLADQCTAVHEHYMHHVRTRRPFVTLKSAASLDGRIATRTGDSRWITGEAARTEVHRLRADHHAIAVGVSTVLIDNPRLDVRHVEGVSPRPIIFDSHLRLAREDRSRAHLMKEGTWVIHAGEAPDAARARLEGWGVQLIQVAASGPAGRVDLLDALQMLGGRDIRSLLVEGGSTLLASWISASLWQRWYYFIAPCILGIEGRPVAPVPGGDSVAAAPRFESGAVRRFGEDMLWILDHPLYARRSDGP